MKLLERLPKSLRPWLFAVAWVFVYGGAVNLGFSDFFMALPFALFVIYAAAKWGRQYVFFTVLLVMVVVPLYYLKKTHSSVFYPAVGQMFTVSEDVCLVLHKSSYSGSEFVSVSSITPDRSCGSDKDSDAVRWVTLKAQTPLQIRQIKVSHADMGESYVIHTDSELGDVAFYGSEYTVWPDGRRIEQRELRRAIFYIPSILMYWPTGPIMLMALFKQ